MRRVVDLFWCLGVLGVVAYLGWGDLSRSATAACGDGCTLSQCLESEAGQVLLEDPCPKMRRTDPPNIQLPGPISFSTRYRTVVATAICPNGSGGTPLGTATGCPEPGMEGDEWFPIEMACHEHCDDT